MSEEGNAQHLHGIERREWILTRWERDVMNLMRKAVPGHQQPGPGASLSPPRRGSGWRPGPGWGRNGSSARPTAAFLGQIFRGKTWSL